MAEESRVSETGRFGDGVIETILMAERPEAVEVGRVGNLQLGTCSLGGRIGQHGGISLSSGTGSGGFRR